MERLVEQKQLTVRRLARTHAFIQCHSHGRAKALASPVPSGVIDEYPTHQLRGNAVEVRAILPDDMLLPNQSEVRLVDECRWLKCVVCPFLAKIGGCPPAELLVDQGHESFSCFDVAFPPCAQQAADGTSFRRVLIWSWNSVGSHDAMDSILSRYISAGVEQLPEFTTAALGEGLSESTGDSGFGVCEKEREGEV